MKKLLSLVAILAFMSLFVAMVAIAQDDEEDMDMQAAPIVTLGDFADLDVSLGTFNLFMVGMDITGLNAALPEGDYTLFVPTDEAFLDLAERLGVDESVLFDDDLLRGLLLYHIVEGTYTAEELPEALNSGRTGEEIMFGVLGDDSVLFLNETTSVLAADIITERGVIHVIDSILLPPSMLDGDLIDIDLVYVTEIVPVFEQVVVVEEVFVTEEVIVQEEVVIVEEVIVTEVVEVVDIVYETEEVFVTEVVFVTPVPMTQVVVVEEEVVVTEVVVVQEEVVVTEEVVVVDVVIVTEEVVVQEEVVVTEVVVVQEEIIVPVEVVVDLDAAPDAILVDTLCGVPFELRLVDETLVINGETIVSDADLMSANGVIHVIDEVLTPGDEEVDLVAVTDAIGTFDAYEMMDGDDDVTSVVLVSDEEERFTTLVAAVDAAGLVETVDGITGYTLFAPENSAFEVLLAELELDAEDLLGDTELLTSVLACHVVEGEYTASDLIQLFADPID